MTWRRSSSAMRAGSRFGSASTLRDHGGRAARRSAPAASSGASFSAAGAISAQWKGADTGSGDGLLGAALLARSRRRRSTAAASPAITVCSGELKLAGATTRAGLAGGGAAGSRRRPRRARPARPPSRRGPRARPPACSDRARARGATASSKRHGAARDQRGVLAEAVARDVGGRDGAALLERAQQCDARRQDRRLLDLGAAQLVLRSLEAEPRERKPSTASAASKTARAAGDVSQTSRPMPTSWDP